MIVRRLAWVTLLGAAAMAAVSCHRPVRRHALPPIPMSEAVKIVNRNLAGIRGTLRASGSVDGYFTSPDGRTRSYHVDGVLFYLAPFYVRFDLKAFGERQFQVGANAKHYWYYTRDEGAYRCFSRRELHPPPEIPLRPDQIIEALGLTLIPPLSSAIRPADQGERRGSQGVVPSLRVQRVVDEYQQILFLTDRKEDGTVLEKEYWLDRYRPRLIRRVVFRDGNGVVQMESFLDEYRSLGGIEPGSLTKGPDLPHVMTADWPSAHARMRFRIAKWTLLEDIGPDGIQFALPRTCSRPG